jgi:hypothetical protein
MALGQAFAFLVAISLVIAFAVLGVIRLGFLRLESRLGWARDALRPGKNAPPWRYRDLAGEIRQVPSLRLSQVLVFGDHSLLEFPDLLDGLAQLGREHSDLEIIILTRHPEHTARALAELTLPVTVVPTDEKLYLKYNVRVMPFVYLLDERGVVRAAGPVNSAAGLLHKWQISRSPLASQVVSRRAARRIGAAAR